MLKSTFRPALPMIVRGPCAEQRAFNNCPQVKSRRDLLANAADAITLPALTALERVLTTETAAGQEIVARNYAYLERVGFCFEKIEGKKVLALEGETLKPQSGWVAYEEISSQNALLGFLSRREATMQARYEELWSLWNNAPVGYHTLDTKAIITAVNQTEADMLGFAPEEMRGDPIFNFIHPDQRTLARERFEQKLAGKDVPPAQTRIYVKKDGSYLYMSAADSVVYNAANNPVGIKTVLVDISRIRELEIQLWRMSKLMALGNLAAGFSHGFGNLITPIQLCSSMAQRELQRNPNPNLEGPLQEISESAAMAAKLIQGIRSYANTSTHANMTSKITPQHICGQVINALRLSPNPESHTVEYKLTVLNHLQIEGVEHQVTETIMNLCLNARDALSQGGLIEIEIKDTVVIRPQITTSKQTLQPGKYVVISVRDNGSGIPPGIGTQMFEPLFTTKDQSRNSGMGLAILLSIMDLHNGGVDVDSTPGKGSKFTVYFPGIKAE